MEARVQALDANLVTVSQTRSRIEASMPHVARDVGDLREKDVSELKVKVAGLEGRVGAMPTTMQLTLFVLAVLACGLGRSFFGG